MANLSKSRVSRLTGQLDMVLTMLTRPSTPTQTKKTSFITLSLYSKCIAILHNDIVRTVVCMGKRCTARVVGDVLGFTIVKT